MNEYYKKIWVDLIGNLTVEQKNEPGKFKEVHIQFYNRICVPDRDVYAGDVMLYYLQHMQKPCKMSLRDFRLK